GAECTEAGDDAIRTSQGNSKQFAGNLRSFDPDMGVILNLPRILASF
ncbi:hypothetical protein L195_g028965, partial [Trifolium pratense]